MNWGKTIKNYSAIAMLCMLCATPSLNALSRKPVDPEEFYQQGREDEATGDKHRYIRTQKRAPYKRGRADMRQEMKKETITTESLSKIVNARRSYEKQKSFYELNDHGPMYGSIGVQALR